MIYWRPLSPKDNIDLEFLFKFFKKSENEISRIFNNISVEEKFYYSTKLNSLLIKYFDVKFDNNNDQIDLENRDRKKHQKSRILNTTITLISILKQKFSH